MTFLRMVSVCTPWPRGLKRAGGCRARENQGLSPENNFSF